MTTSSEGVQLAHMGGLPSETPRFKKKPTLIEVPKNNPSQYHSQANGRNPYGLPKTRPSSSNSMVGNLTASRILASGSRGRDDQEPSAKRRKVDYDSGLGQGKYLHSRRRKSRPSVGPDVIDVDVDDFVDETHIASGSSVDELNTIPPRHSRHFSSRQNMQDSEMNRGLTIVPDGEDTIWAQNQLKSDNDIESDPIESSTDYQLPSSYSARTEGIVRGKVKKINMACEEEAGLKIDLSTIQKQKKSTGIVKNMKLRNPLQKQKRNSATLKFDEEHISHASSTTLSARKERETFPVKEAYLDDRFYPIHKGQILKMFWHSELMCIEADGDEVYKILLLPEHCRSIEMSKIEDGPPILHVRNVNNSTATIRLDNDYNGTNWVKLKEVTKLANPGICTISPTSALWDCAIQEATELKKSRDTTSERKQEKARKLADLNALRDPQNNKNSMVSNMRKRKGPLDPIPGLSLTSERSSPPGSVELKVVSGTPPKPRRNTRQGTDSSSVRRSTRTVPPKERNVVPDKLILVYPPGPGAVNINMTDRNRLEDGEYLNDTLIEFGLKFWLRGLEEENPTLASQVHIFNSFFYKKLNHGRDIQQTYESVKKWTSKIDIFEKKYIIVPINEHLHWYLAIICEPGHILSAQNSNTPSTRKQTRSTAHAVEKAISSAGTSDGKDEQNVTSSEAEVERNLNDEFQSSCTIENDEDPELPVKVIADDDDATSSTALSYVTHEDEDDSRRPFPSLSERPNMEAVTRSPSASSSGMVVDLTEEIDPPPNLDAIIPGVFYDQDRLKTRKGKEKARSEADILILDDKVQEIVDDEASRKTYIFIMDSLGTKHPQAVNKLSKYLKMEANDKKGISEAGFAIGKFAAVPVQPNFCDCGVYLLHFAKTFMSDPVRYTKGILAQPTKSIANKERQNTWNDPEVANMRNSLKAIIDSLSEDWQKERSLEISPNDADTDSDSDVIFVSSTDTKVNKAANGSNRSSKSGTAQISAPNTKSAANRLRGR